MQVVLERRPSACDLVPSAQPAYVSDFACFSGFGACASKRASVQPAIESDSACPAQSAYVNEPSLAGAPLLLDIVQEATAMKANVPQAGKPSVEYVPRRLALGPSSPPSVALGFRPDSAVQPPLQAAEPPHNVNPYRVAPSLTALEGWPSTSRAAPSEVLEVSAATPECD